MDDETIRAAKAQQEFEKREREEMLGQEARTEESAGENERERCNVERRVCTECGWQGLKTRVLQAANSFDFDDVINGCSNCCAVNTVRTTCDEPGCWRSDTIGTPTPTGYRRTCREHEPGVSAR